MTSPLYNICTRCGRRGHCAASCKEPINAALSGAEGVPLESTVMQEAEK